MPDHDVGSTVDRLVHVEEPRLSTDLLHLGVAEGSLDDDVDELLSGRVGLICEVVLQVEYGVSLLTDDDGVLIAIQHGIELDVLLKFTQQVDDLTRAHIEAKSCVHGLAFRAQDFLDLSGVVELEADDLDAVLVHRDVLAERQLVLVRNNLDALHVLVQWHKSTGV